MQSSDKQVVQVLIQEVWGKGHLSKLDELLDPGVVIHVDSQVDPVVGVEGYSQIIATYQALFGVVEFTIEEQLQDGDKVVTRWHARRSGTNDDLPTMGISIHRVADGRIAESWDTWDMLSALDTEEDRALLDGLGITS